MSPNNTPIKIRAFYPYYNIIGINYTTNFGNLMISGEIGFQLNRLYETSHEDDTDELVQKDHFQMTQELSYKNRGVIPYQVSFNWSESSVMDWDENIKSSNRLERKFAFAVSKTFMHETLKLSYKNAYEIYNAKDYKHQFNAIYYVNDELSTSAIITYLGSRAEENLTEEEKAEMEERHWTLIVQYSF